ncbi:MAG TPA: MATE family efflux transporter, partial [Gammaproteobacteria bacterium]|nr:MATE family efflux transporter [Gammaproteobacteria bacterium]
MSASQLEYGRILQQAWPLILANAAVPILGLVDTAVIGNLGSIEDLGAIAFGAMIFSFVYWGFGFLRMGTTGFVAQALGVNDHIEIRTILGRSLLMAVSLGLILIALQWPIQIITFAALDGSAAVEETARAYFAIRIW